MTSQQTAHDEPVTSSCWCCGSDFPETSLLRLGARPEAAVCLQCATFLHRRRTEHDDALDVSIASRGRSVIRRARSLVINHGWQNVPLIGPVLRRFDTWLP